MIKEAKAAVNAYFESDDSKYARARVAQAMWNLRHALEADLEQRNGLPEFYKLLEEAADIHDSKSHDYASNADPLGNYRFAGELAKLFSEPTDSGLIGRFGEKLYRLSNLERKSVNPNNESIEDTETDMLVIIGLFVADRRARRAKK